MGPDLSVDRVKNLMGCDKKKEIKNTQVRESRKRKSSLSLYIYTVYIIYIGCFNIGTALFYEQR